jgi:hypothetical protein
MVVVVVLLQYIVDISLTDVQVVLVAAQALVADATELHTVVPELRDKDTQVTDQMTIHHTAEQVAEQVAHQQELLIKLQDPQQVNYQAALIM